MDNSTNGKQRTPIAPRLQCYLVLDLREAEPVTAMLLRAGFERVDYSARVLCGYLMVAGKQRYYEAKAPAWMKDIYTETEDKTAEFSLIFNCTEQPAEPEGFAKRQ